MVSSKNGVTKPRTLTLEETWDIFFRLIQERNINLEKITLDLNNETKVVHLLQDYHYINTSKLERSTLVLNHIYFSYITLCYLNEAGVNVHMNTLPMIRAQSDCPICLEPLEGEHPSNLVGCSKGMTFFNKNSDSNTNPHIFHTRCYILWSKKDISCPVCRSNDSNITPLQLALPYLHFFAKK